MTVAMLFLVEATTACGPAAPARLAGGAEVVQAILDVEEQAPDPSLPTLTGLSRSTGTAPGYAGPNDPDPDPAPARCKPVPMPIA